VFCVPAAGRIRVRPTDRAQLGTSRGPPTALQNFPGAREYVWRPNGRRGAVVSMGKRPFRDVPAATDTSIIEWDRWRRRRRDPGPFPTQKCFPPDYQGATCVPSIRRVTTGILPPPRSPDSVGGVILSQPTGRFATLLEAVHAPRLIGPCGMFLCGLHSRCPQSSTGRHPKRSKPQICHACRRARRFRRGRT